MFTSGESMFREVSGRPRGPVASLGSFVWYLWYSENSCKETFSNLCEILLQSSLPGQNVEATQVGLFITTQNRDNPHININVSGQKIQSLSRPSKSWSLVRFAVPLLTILVQPITWDVSGVPISGNALLPDATNAENHSLASTHQCNFLETWWEFRRIRTLSRITQHYQ